MKIIRGLRYLLALMILFSFGIGCAVPKNEGKYESHIGEEKVGFPLELVTYPQLPTRELSEQDVIAFCWHNNNAYESGFYPLWGLNITMTTSPNL